MKWVAALVVFFSILIAGVIYFGKDDEVAKETTEAVEPPKAEGQTPTCPGCASHENWPPVQSLTISRPRTAGCPTCSIKRRIVGDARNNELLGGHESNTISGRAGDDVIWGDFNPSGQSTRQTDRM